MNTTTRPQLGLIDGDRDRHLVRVGVLGTNAELAAVVARLKHRAPLQVAVPVPASPTETKRAD